MFCCRYLLGERKSLPLSPPREGKEGREGEGEGEEGGRWPPGSAPELINASIDSYKLCNINIIINLHIQLDIIRLLNPRITRLSITVSYGSHVERP